MKTVLLTGFEPFGGDRVNPSAEIVRQLNGEIIAGHAVKGVVLPCVFRRAPDQLSEHIRLDMPVLVICLGLASGRTAITPERVAVNISDAPIPDNAGCQPVDEPIVRGGPAAYFSTLPTKAIVQALRTRGIPSELSHTAGTFVCNHLFYSLMHHLATLPCAPMGGFIHVPATTDQQIAGLPLNLTIEGVRVAIQTALSVKADLLEPLGRIA